MSNLKRKLQVGAVAVLTIIITAYVYFNAGSGQANADISALRSMGVPFDDAPPSQESPSRDPKAFRERYARFLSPSDQKKLLPPTDAIAFYPGSEFARYNYEQLLDRGRENTRLLQAILDDSNVIAPPVDCRQILKSFPEDDLKLFDDPSDNVDEIRDDSSGTLKWILDHSTHRKAVRDIAEKDLRMWLEAFEKFPQGKLDCVAALHVCRGVLDEYPEVSTSDNYLVFQGSFRRGTAAIANLVGQLAHDRMIRLCAHLLLVHQQTGRYPATLPDFGTDSIDPINGKPFRYLVQQNGRGFLLGGSIPGSARNISF